MLVLGALGGSALAVMAGLPYWRLHPRFAAANTGVVVAFLLAGILFASVASSRLCGLVFIASSLLWCAQWLASWQTVGVIPVVAFFSGWLFFPTTGYGIMIYQDGRLRDRLE